MTGFGDGFFAGRQLTELVLEYQRDRSLDQTTAEVEVWLRDGSRFLAEEMRVATRYVVFHTEDDEHICVPKEQVTKVRIGRRPKPDKGRQVGFSQAPVDSAAES